LPKATLHRELPEVAADLVLIPIQPSPYDVSAAKEIVTLLEESPNDLEAAFIASRKIVDTAIAARRCRLPEYISLASPEGRYFAARRVRRATAPRAHRASDNRTQ
jgi:hypothetical protein